MSNSDALKPGERVVIWARLFGDQNRLETLLSTQVPFINLLMYLNSREKGGVEAEREERERWITREQQKIMDSVNGKLIVRLHCLVSPCVWSDFTCTLELQYFLIFSYHNFLFLSSALSKMRETRNQENVRTEYCSFNM